MKAARTRVAYQILRRSGVDPLLMLKSLYYLPRFIQSAYKYSVVSHGSNFPLRLRYVNPMLSDFGLQSGSAAGHYFWQDLWAARKIFLARPSEHVDVGSRIDGFVAHLLSFMPVTVIDIRPLHSVVPGLTYVQDDATELAGLSDASIASLSSLHAAEHFGLGRYGDAVDADAWAKFLRALVRVLKPGGRLYLSVPVGSQRVEFNAHRVFAPNTILDTCSDLDLLSFAAVDDTGAFHEPACVNDFSSSTYSCGLFEFTKRGKVYS